MKLKIWKQDNFLTAVFFLLIGLGTIWISTGYPFGTVGNMGPGYFPTILGIILCLLSLVLFADSIKFDGKEERTISWNLWPVLSITASVVLFAFLIKPYGLVLATVAVVFVSGFGSKKVRWVSSVISAITLSIVVTVIFKFALGLNLQIFPSTY